MIVLLYNMNFRILKMFATGVFLTALECTEFVFGRGSGWTPLGSLQRSPDLLAGLRGPRTFKGKGRGEEGKGEERKKGKGEKGKGKRERKGMGRPPLRKFLDPPMTSIVPYSINERLARS